MPPDIPLIITPHPGEAARLADVRQPARLNLIGFELGKRHSRSVMAGVVVLKGAGTVVASLFQGRSSRVFAQGEIPVWQRAVWETCWRA